MNYYSISSTHGACCTMNYSIMDDNVGETKSYDI